MVSLAQSVRIPPSAEVNHVAKLSSLSHWARHMTWERVSTTAAALQGIGRLDTNQTTRHEHAHIVSSSNANRL